MKASMFNQNGFGIEHILGFNKKDPCVGRDLGDKSMMYELHQIPGPGFRLTLFLVLHAIILVSVGRADEIINFETLPVDTVVFDQFAGVEFPGTPLIVTPTLPSASGVQALSNFDPDDEFNNQPLVVVFSAPQRFVRLAAGLDVSSAATVEAVFRAFNAAGIQVTEDVSAIGPGPVGATTVMSVEMPDPVIMRVELEYANAFIEVIDDLTFEVTGDEPPPDNTAPIVSILLPADGAEVTSNFFMLTAEIEEDRQLRSVSLEIINTIETNTIPLSFGDGPVHTIGPINISPLAAGMNTVNLTAEDFAGNIGTDTPSRLPGQIPWRY